MKSDPKKTMEDLTITVYIADRPYRLKIRKDEEEFIKKAVEEIKKMTQEFSSNYAFNDKQDLLAMTALHFAVSADRQEPRVNHEPADLIERLKYLDELISS